MTAAAADGNTIVAVKPAPMIKSQIFIKYKNNYEPVQHN